MNAQQRRDALSKKAEKKGFEVGHGGGEQRMGQYIYDLTISKNGLSVNVSFPCRDFNPRESGADFWIRPGDKIDFDAILNAMS